MSSSLYIKAIILIVSTLIPMETFAQCFLDTFHGSLWRRDFEAVQTFVNSKRRDPLLNKKGELRITGDVQIEFYHTTERAAGKNLRGFKITQYEEVSPGVFRAIPSSMPVSKDDTNILLNVDIEYRVPRAWARAKFQFDSNAGIQSFGRQTCTPNNPLIFGSGDCNDICLKRAYIGYRILECKDVYTLDVEIGRRTLNHVFESYLQFKNRFDGILLKFSRNIKPSSNFYFLGCVFIVDERAKHFAYVTEMGFLNFLNKRVDIRYSFIDWKSLLTNDRNRCRKLNPFGSQFRISQVTLDLNLPLIYNRKAQIYGGGLINHAAQRIPLTHYTKQNLGAYAGFIIGEVKKRGEWAVDISYEVLQAQGVPDSDVSGIDRGNFLGTFFYTTGRGKTNYKGWEFQYLYAITDKLFVNNVYRFSSALDQKIGGTNSFHQVFIQLTMPF